MDGTKLTQSRSFGNNNRNSAKKWMGIGVFKFFTEVAIGLSKPCDVFRMLCIDIIHVSRGIGVTTTAVENNRKIGCETQKMV